MKCLYFFEHDMPTETFAFTFYRNAQQSSLNQSQVHDHFVMAHIASASFLNSLTHTHPQTRLYIHTLIDSPHSHTHAHVNSQKICNINRNRLRPLLVFSVKWRKIVDLRIVIAPGNLQVLCIYSPYPMCIYVSSFSTFSYFRCRKYCACQ